MNFKGKAHCFGDNINTDYIISSHRKRDTLDMKDLAPYLLEAVDPQFYQRISPGDFIVAGHNFGCGSSREAAPLVIKAAGISAVLGKSFARIFYRNSLNCGLPVIEVNTDVIQQGSNLELTLGASGGQVRIVEGDIIIPVQFPGEFALQLLKNGGLFEYLRKHPNLDLPSS